jgi:IS30 family transposase
MNDRFREILDTLPATPLRSRLEPYTELIQVLHEQKRSYREIARILAERCGVRVSHSTLYEFVQRHVTEAAFDGSDSQPDNRPANWQAKTKATTAHSDVKQRIEALKRKSPALPDELPPFRFDGSEPLRLKPEKP